jgi:hypothetical protein
MATRAYAGSEATGRLFALPHMLSVDSATKTLQASILTDVQDREGAKQLPTEPLATSRPASGSRICRRTLLAFLRLILQVAVVGHALGDDFPRDATDSVVCSPRTILAYKAVFAGTAWS